MEENKTINHYLAATERAAVDFLAVFAPWLGPIPSAYLVGKAARDRLGWADPIAWIAAIAVESIGVVSVVLALRLYEWNNTKNKSDPAAPFWLAMLCTGFYFVVTIGLTVLLDVYPELAQFAPAIFPLLAAIGAVNIAVKNGQARRESEKRRAKEERRAAHVSTEIKAESKPKPKARPRVSPETETADPAFGSLSGYKLDVARFLSDENGRKLSNAEIGRRLGISGQRVGQIKQELGAAAGD